MAELFVVHVLQSGLPLSRADVLAVAEITAGHLAQDQAQGRHHGDIGPHTLLLDLADPVTGGVRDARLIAPQPGRRPQNWPTPPEGESGPAADVFALGQVLRSLDAHARSAADDSDLPPFVQRMIAADPAHRPTAQDLLIAFDEGLIRPPPPVAAGRHTSNPRVTVSNGDSGALSPAAAEPATTGSWPLVVAAAAVFALVLGGGLWWTNQGGDPIVEDASTGAAPGDIGAGNGPDDVAPATPTSEAAPGAAGEPVAETPSSDSTPPEADTPTAGRPAPGATLSPEITSPPEGPSTVVAMPRAATSLTRPGAARTGPSWPGC